MPILLFTNSLFAFADTKLIGKKRKNILKKIFLTFKELNLITFIQNLGKNKLFKRK